MKKSFLLLNKVNDRFWNAVARATNSTIKSIAAFRIVTGLCLLTVYAHNYGWVGEMPKAFFLPPILSPVNIFTRGYPSTGFFVTMDFLLLLAAFGITLGIKTRISSIIYVIVSIICINFEFSFGKIGHNIFLYLLLICMSFSDWGTKLALYPDKPHKMLPAKSLGLLAVMLCFGFFSAAFEKSLNWINFDFTTAGTARWYYNSFFNLGRGYFFAPYLLNAPFWLFKLMDFTAVIFELSPLFFLLYSRRAWHVFLLIAVSFHLINALFFNISFIGNGLVYLAFISYDKLYDFFEKVFTKKPVWIFISIALLLIAIARIRYIFDYDKSLIMFLPPVQITQLYGIVVIWLIVATCLLLELFKTDRTIKAI